MEMSTSQIVLWVIFAIVMIALGWVIGDCHGAEMTSKIYRKYERQEYGPSLIDKDVVRATRDLIAADEHYLLRVVGEYSDADIEAFEARWNEILQKPRSREEIARVFRIPPNYFDDKEHKDG